MEIEGISLPNFSSIWTKDLSLFGTEGDRADFGLDIVSSSHNELVDAVRNGVHGDLGNPFGTGGVSVDCAKHGCLADHVLPVDSHSVEVGSMVKLDEIDEPVGGGWFVIEWGTNQVTVWTLRYNLVEIDLIVSNSEGLNRGQRFIVILHISDGADGGY